VTTPVAGAAAPTTPLGGSATENCYSVACWTEPSAFYPVSAPRRLVPFPFSARQSALGTEGGGSLLTQWWWWRSWSRRQASATLIMVSLFTFSLPPPRLPSVGLSVAWPQPVGASLRRICH
jgi:hypothetical protein